MLIVCRTNILCFLVSTRESAPSQNHPKQSCSSQQIFPEAAVHRSGAQIGFVPGGELYVRTCSHTLEMTTDPSPTEAATRLTELARTSPTAKIPGCDVA